MISSLTSWLTSKWWKPILLLNLFFVFITALYPYLPEFSQKWRLVTPFSLHAENNIAVWWSGMLLLLAAILAFEKSKSSTNSWVIISGILACLSLDEIGSIHERVGILKGWSGVLPFAFILSGFALYALFDIARHNKDRISAIFIIIGFALFASVALQEFIEHKYTWEAWIKGLRVGVEEGTELLGIFFILLAVLKKNRPDINKSYELILPDKTTHSSLNIIFLMALAIHIIGCFVMIYYLNPFHRGNPMNWYPVCLLFYSFLACLRNGIESKLHNKVWFTISILCLFSSIAIMSDLIMMLIPNFGNIINNTFLQEQFIIIYAIHLVIFCLVYFRTPIKLRYAHVIGIVLTTGLAILSIYQENTLLRYCAIGLISYLVFRSTIQKSSCN